MATNISVVHDTVTADLGRSARYTKDKKGPSVHPKYIGFNLCRHGTHVRVVWENKMTCFYQV